MIHNKTKYKDIVDLINSREIFTLITTEEEWKNGNKIKVKCKEHNHIKEITITQLKNLQSCYECRKEKVIKEKERKERRFDKNDEEYQKFLELFENNEDFEILTKHIRIVKEQIEIKCKHCSKISKNSFFFNYKRGRKIDLDCNCLFEKENKEYWKHLLEKENYSLIKIDYKQKKIYFVCDKGHKHSMFFSNWHNGQRCGKCFSLNRSSKKEKEINDFILSLGLKTIQNDRNLISPKEIDILVPSHKLAIEFNGTYWHSEKFKEENYHQEKFIKCRENGYKLLQIKEIDWDKKKEIVKSIICAKLGIFNERIFARKCQIKEIENKTYREFCEENHIQGYVQAKYKYGLFFNEKLIMLCSVGKSRFKKNEFEIIRLCSLKYTQIIGGVSKLINFIQNKYDFNCLVSYVDLMYGNGEGYKDFKEIEITKPNYFYINQNNEIVTRYMAQKHKLKKLLNIFDENLSESQNMLNNGYRKQFDGGNLKLFYKN